MARSWWRPIFGARDTRHPWWRRGYSVDWWRLTAYLWLWLPLRVWRVQLSNQPHRWWLTLGPVEVSYWYWRQA